MPDDNDSDGNLKNFDQNNDIIDRNDPPRQEQHHQENRRRPIFQHSLSAVIDEEDEEENEGVEEAGDTGPIAATTTAAPASPSKTIPPGTNNPLSSTISSPALSSHHEAALTSKTFNTEGTSSSSSSSMAAKLGTARSMSTVSFADYGAAAGGSGGGNNEGRIRRMRRNVSTVSLKISTLPSIDENEDNTMKMFVELYDLKFKTTTKQPYWQETARWIKYEEDAEGADHHWGRPHVAFLSFHALNQLKVCLQQGLIALDIEATSFAEVCEKISKRMAEQFRMDEQRTHAVLSTLKRRHKHVHEQTGPLRKISSVGKTLKEMGSGHDHQTEMDIQEIMKRLPTGAESTQVFVGVLGELKESRFSMVRLREPTHMPELLDAPIPIRFLFVILGPAIYDVNYHEIGRSIATLMSNPHFLNIAATADSKRKILNAIDEFLDRSIVIPPGEIDSKNLISTDEIKKALKQRKYNNAEDDRVLHEKIIGYFDRMIEAHSTNTKNNPIAALNDPGIMLNVKKRKKRTDPLKRTGRLFGGLINDLRYRAPDYLNDFKDGLNVQCIMSLVFIFSASFIPAVTFGGLLSLAYRGGEVARPLSYKAPESISAWIHFCDQLDLDFLTIRVWTSLFIVLTALITVMFEGSFLVRYVTPFTEDIFEILISIIFISEAIKFIKKTFTIFPVNNLPHYISKYGQCLANQPARNDTAENGVPYPYDVETDVGPSVMMNETTSKYVHLHVELSETPYILDPACAKYKQPDTALLTLLLLVGTFGLAVVLRNIGNSHFFGRRVRRLISGNTYRGGEVIRPGHCNRNMQIGFTKFVCNIEIGLKSEVTRSGYGISKCAIEFQIEPITARGLITIVPYNLAAPIRRGLGDFGVVIALLVVGLFDQLVFPLPFLERVQMPTSFGFTNETARGHGVMVNIWLPPDKWLGYLFAAVPALFVYILLFMETEITELLLMKKSRGLQKGSGFHWDLLLLGLIAFICSLFGLPWMCAASVESVAHVTSLSVMKVHAPGERPRVAYVIEQRITTILCALMLGGCAFCGSILERLPLANLYGIFLYFGFVNLIPVHYIHRILLLFVPRKYFPDHSYCQDVPTKKMHMWTLLQTLCLTGVYLVKHFKQSSLGFPFAVAIVAVLRMTVFPKFYTAQEIEALDGHEEDEEVEEHAFPYSIFHIHQ